MTRMLICHPLAFRYEINGGTDRFGNEWCRVVIFRDCGSSPMHLGDECPVLGWGKGKTMTEAIGFAVTMTSTRAPNFAGVNSPRWHDTE